MLHIILWKCNVEVNVSVGVLSSGIVVPSRFNAQWGSKPFKKASLPVDYTTCPNLQIFAFFLSQSSNFCLLFDFKFF